MSNITTAQAAILSALATLFPSASGYTRIFNSLNLNSNPEHVLRKGYGLLIGGSDFGEAEFCSFRDDHVYTVVLTREVVMHDSEVANIDAQAIAFKEDAFAARKRLYQVDKLGQQTAIENITLGSATGITTFFNRDIQFLTMSFDFTVQVRENL